VNIVTGEAITTARAAAAVAAAIAEQAAASHAAQCVAEEEPDGYDDEPLKVAVFTVEHVNAATAQHRTGRWERALGSRRSSGET
jgi:hypothetical protein